MSGRVFNFSPGPSTLPLEVLETAQKELINFKDSGMSIMEHSHRGKVYEAVHNEAKALLCELLDIPENYEILFLQGGASLQFDMIPLNFISQGGTADYILTGSFAEKAYKEAKKIGETHVAASTKELNYQRVIKQEELQLSENPVYVHMTSNNTIFGTQFKEFPNVRDIPLVCDMSSDILSKKIDISKFALIYAGAQKNLGPSGVTIVIIRKDLLEKVNTNQPSMLRYDIMAENNSLYNTAPTFSIYMVNLVLKWVKENGGLAKFEKQNEEKAGYIYDAIDNSNGFYKGHAEKESRSLMNITFRLPSEDLEKAFIDEATKQGLSGLKGHRSVGGIRASIYNAMPVEGCKSLAEFMVNFQKKNS